MICSVIYIKQLVSPLCPLVALVLWYCGTVVLWYCGTVVLWCPDDVVLCTF